MTPDLTLSELARAGLDDAEVSEAAKTLQMDEEAFRVFYDRTARPLWAYLARLTGDPRLADDLLQDAYYRFLRTTTAFDDDAHRRNYLFRIATNLVQDSRRRKPFAALDGDAGAPASAVDGDAAARSASRIDVRRAMARLTVRERALLWLAYANGSSHEEIARSLGLRRSSIKMLLFRARRRMAALLGDASHD